MSKTDDGGPAFPRSDGGYSPTQDGMSLRDWFAGQALAGLASCERQMDARTIIHGTDDVPRWLADCAYAVADAMLAARATGQECRHCKGEGSVADYVGDDMRCIEAECPDCRGTGRATGQAGEG